MSGLGDYFLHQEYSKIVGLGKQVGRNLGHNSLGTISANTCRQVPGYQGTWWKTPQRRDAADQNARSCRMAWSVRFRG
jgi:hypothetical protein